MSQKSRHPLDEPSDGALVESSLVGDIFRQMDAGESDDDGSAGVREPLRPHDAPPALTAQVEPNDE